MANILDPMDLKQIITLHLDGASNRRIGSVLGISRNISQPTFNPQITVFSEVDLGATSVVFIFSGFTLGKPSTQSGSAFVIAATTASRLTSTASS